MKVKEHHINVTCRGRQSSLVVSTPERSTKETTGEDEVVLCHPSVGSTVFMESFGPKRLICLGPTD